MIGGFEGKVALVVGAIRADVARDGEELGIDPRPLTPPPSNSSGRESIDTLTTFRDRVFPDAQAGRGS